MLRLSVVRSRPVGIALQRHKSLNALKLTPRINVGSTQSYLKTTFATPRIFLVVLIINVPHIASSLGDGALLIIHALVVVTLGSLIDYHSQPQESKLLMIL
jgi:hypothetical protein